MIALYSTIWLAITCLVLGEYARGVLRAARVSPGWAVPVSALGVSLAAVHSVLAIGVAYHWDHALAARLTAERAATVYGVAWPGSLYVNYVFLAFWALDTAWWARAPRSFATRPAAVEWLWRLFAFTMIVNGAVVFASPAGRWAGVPLTAALLVLWLRDRPGARA